MNSTGPPRASVTAMPKIEPLIREYIVVAIIIIIQAKCSKFIRMLESIFSGVNRLFIPPCEMSAAP